MEAILWLFRTVNNRSIRRRDIFHAPASGNRQRRPYSISNRIASYCTYVDCGNTALS